MAHDHFEFSQGFMLSWHQRQFLFFLADRASETSINPESDGVKPHWDAIENLKTQGLLDILDIVGTHRKDIKLTELGRNLVSALREQERKAKPL